MSVRTEPTTTQAEAVAAVAAGATGLDRAPAFPREAFAALRDAGLTSFTVPTGEGADTSPRDEWAAVRAVARADGSVARILDGHLNAVERLAVAAPEPLRREHLDCVAGGELLLGVWGADPGEGEGPPARLDGDRVHGVKTFCSGAGGVGAALVLVRGDAPGPPLLAYVDLRDGVEIDRSWYRAPGMRASESHRVVFDGARVLAVLGEPGEIAREPWFGRDAIRTAACWAGLVDAVREEALAALATRPEDDQLAALAAGRMVSQAGTVDAWFERAAAAVEADPGAPTADLSIALRTAVAAAARATVSEAVGAAGSRPLVAGGRLDRSRRDLELFLNQHRLDPLVARLGRRALSR
jgi:alkylation response protein AidB-like acyl-CoA dehydrogenase